MADKRITAIELARNLSALLNEVRYRAVSLEVWRGRECIARVVPPSRPAGLSVERLNGLLATLPKLDPANAQAFERDLEQLGQTVSEPSVPRSARSSGTAAPASCYLLDPMRSNRGFAAVPRKRFHRWA